MRSETSRSVAALLGVLFGGFGVVQAGLGLALFTLPEAWAFALPPSLLDGYVLAVIGALFLTGARVFPSDEETGVAYTYVAAVFAIAYGLLSLLVLLAGAADLLIAGGEEVPARVESIGPALYLTVLVLPAYLAAGKRFRQEV